MRSTVQLVSAYLAKTCTRGGAAVFQCLADNRDHSECCAKQNVQRPCLPLCNPHSGVTLGSNQAACLGDFDTKIKQCFREH